MEKSMSLYARARSMTTNELLALFPTLSKVEQGELAEELYKRLEHLSRAVIGSNSMNSYHHVHNG
jgi:hypothetical protein